MTQSAKTPMPGYVTDDTVWEVVLQDNSYCLQAHHGDKYDERLVLSGNFPDDDTEFERAQSLCDQLNGADIDARGLFTNKRKIIRDIDKIIEELVKLKTTTELLRDFK